MTYQGTNPIFRTADYFGNPASLDAFGSMRVSQKFALNLGKQPFDDNPLIYDTSVTGTGTVTYDQPTASSIMSVGVASGDVAIRQTHLYQNYQPGKSQLVFATFQIDNTAWAQDTCFRVGYFDANDGIFLEVLGAAAPVVNMVLRTSATGGATQTVPQASWNIDVLDGSQSSSNPSGLTLDLDGKSQIWGCQMEWLGVGSVTTFFVIGGQIVPVHRFDYSNVSGAGIVYMQTPNLPVRWELESQSVLAVAAQARSICASVMSEGGEDPVGNFRSANRGSGTGKTINAGVLELIVGLKLKNTPNATGREPAVVTSMSMLTLTQAEFLWEIRRNPTVGGAAVYTSVPNSPVEYDINLTAAGSRVVSAGEVLFSGYVTGSITGSGTSMTGLQSLLTRLGSDIAGTRDTIVLCASPIGSNEEFFGSLGWFEYG